MPESPVVSNTTPLISLVGIGQLDLLHQLYGAIWIPTAVLAEYQAGAQPSHPNLAAIPWIVVHTVVVEPTLAAMLDPGEAEAIALARAVQARVVILDELRGRRVAQQAGLPLIGSLGVLLRAKQVGLITTVAPLIHAMIGQGRRISPALQARIMAAAGESPA